MNNYIRVTKWIESEHRTVLRDVFAFDGSDRASTVEALKGASKVATAGMRLTMYRRPDVRGPWDELPIVGENLEAA